MNTLESELDHITDLLGPLYNLPSGTLVALTCLIFGYVLRYFRSFPNNAIPLAVILWGAVWFPVLCSFDGKTPIRVWIIRNVFIGLVIGFISWMLHNKFLSKVEDWLASRSSEPPPTTPPVT